MNDLIKSQFYEYLEKFLIELGKSSKKLKKTIDSNYKDIKNEESIECIKKNIYIHKTHFLGKQEELDTFFKDNSIELLDKINLSDIWEKSSNENKNAIIQYIKVFVFMFESSNKTEEESNEEEEESNEDEKSNDNNFEDILKESLLNNDEHLKSFCNSINQDDNSIVNLAKDIASELKQENGTDMDNMANMFSNGNGLNGLINSITSKLDTQMKNGTLDQNKLLNDAQKMMGGNANLFGNLFNNINKNKSPNTNSNSNTNTNTNTNSTTVEEVKEIKTTKKNKKKTKK